MKNKSDVAYNLLEQLITFRELEPGTMVSESQLMKQTELGRTPIREALQKLAAEKMVEIHPRKGILIPLMSVEVQLKLLEVRRTLEEQAVRFAAHRSTVAQKEAMLQLAEQLLDETLYGNPKRYGETLKKVHRAVADSTQNEYLTMAILPLQGLSRRFWFAHIQSFNREFGIAGKLHAATLKAICHGDESKAAEASLAVNDYLTEFAYHTIRRFPGTAR
ncbi:GntR family transcriptional regulator [Marinobacter sp.]|uniref:GntR family transcriptional regulator n=1 Tax=Marinobacter sp. TaxID=50741 RepID=UPI000C51A23A|nr:GntR family transcriptional regulator [Marinobacter sp.]MBE95686.1 GntR family transcriptional regulator [Marinobacter sp.]MBL84899.1 GntR family transcriptional regulator [Marinobacter sp.]|tara:strand:+ start:1068 stop:1724 length:657 start_codon:yes stop_codon:yes gene_type:complete